MGSADSFDTLTDNLFELLLDILTDDKYHMVKASFKRIILSFYMISLIIFDRGYYSEDMFRYCVEHGHVDQVFPELQYFFKSGLHQNSVYALLKEAPTPTAIASMHMTHLTCHIPVIPGLMAILAL